MIVVYKGFGEIIVTTKEDESDTIKSFFTEGGRDIEEYDRAETNDVIVIKSTPRVFYYD